MAVLGTEEQPCEQSSKPWINEGQGTTGLGRQSKDIELMGV